MIDPGQWMHMHMQANTHNHPSPTDFDTYLPWACNQMAVEMRIVVTRTAMSEYVSVVASDRTKIKKPKKAKKRSPSEDGSSQSSSGNYNIPSLVSGADDIVNIHAIYDQFMNLVQIKFLKNKYIPREVIKIITLLVPMYKYLTSITIDCGLRVGTIYDISQLLPVSKVTELCLDNTDVVEANYYILLNEPILKHLSLAKCNLNDEVIRLIAERIVYPCPASKSLTVLNLSTNEITDVGAKYLAEALRSNRRLAYLNLSDNQITDLGAGYIFDILIEFPLTSQETFDKKSRLMIYLKEKKDLFLITINDLRVMDSEKKSTKKGKAVKSQASTTIKRKQSTPFRDKSSTHADAGMSLNERAEAIVQELMGPLFDPFDRNNTVMRDNELCCCGNNTLCYLNIAFNDLTIASVVKLRDVLVAQKEMNRNPKGLVNVRLEGNYLPTWCAEMQDIDAMLEANLSTFKRTSIVKKKTARSTPSKSSS
ncbi:hypothetical protein B5X24_HaOG216712 [Helicoverpa armigera]|nr:hypothetical protein B5X24_HaOG216712 [Helicoverpa armigera]